MSTSKNSREIIVRDNKTFGQLLKNLWLRVTTSHLFSFALICLTGWLFISLSYNFPAFNDVNKTEENFWHLFLRDVGIALFPLALVSLVYEVFLRHNFLQNVSDTIRELMPGRYSHMRESGVVDIYQDLQLDKLKKDLEKLKGSEIRILEIWMENFNRITPSLISAIKERNCTIKIVLWDPKFTDALENRARSLGDGSSVRSMIENIMKNLRYM